MAFLQVDYDRAMAQAKELEMAADKCRKSREDLIREINNSMLCWTGDSGDALRVKAAEVERDLKGTRTQLIAIAASIRRVAEELRKKDKELAGRIGSGGGGGSSW